MLNALDVANFFVYLMPEEENELTNLKINKLLFYAQGHFLQRFAKALFSDEIQAWQYGPVVPTVYHKFKSFKKSPITHIPESFDLSKYSDDEKELLVDVARVYGQFTGEALKNKTHQQGTPWSDVYSPCSRNQVISTELIKDYFDYEPDIAVKEFEIPDDKLLGYHDEDGILTLPSEYEY